MKEASLDDRELVLDFETVPLASCPRTTLVLTNTSAIRARFDLELDHFRAAKPPTPPSGKEYAGRLDNGRHAICNNSVETTLSCHIDEIPESY